MESLYRKYRPQTFADVVGQSHVVSTLEHAVLEGRVSHAYLFCGPRGTGKTTMARILAKSLLCDMGPDHLPDGTCEQCIAVAEGNHPDVYELDAASRTGVDSVREEIINSVGYAPVRGRSKIYIIDEVHMLTTQAFNALLKTLEEPPEHVTFVLCTTDPQMIPETILSRVQRFDFKSISQEDIRKHLAYICDKEGFKYNDEALDLVVRHARGGMRDALSSLEQLSVFGNGSITLEDAQDMLGVSSSSQMHDVAMAIANRDGARLFELIDVLVNNGADLLHFTRQLCIHMRNIYVYLIAEGNKELLESIPEDSDELSTEADAFGSTDRVSYVISQLSKAASEMRYASDQRILLESVMVRLTRPESDLTLEALASRLAELEAKLIDLQDRPAIIQQVQAATTTSIDSTVNDHVSLGVAPIDDILNEVTAKPDSSSHSQENVTKSENESLASSPDTWEYLWKEVTREVEAAMPHIGELLKGSKVVGDDGEELKIALRGGSRFALKALSRDDVEKDTIKPIIRKSFGNRRIVYCEDATNIAKNNAKAKSEIQHSQPSPAQVQNVQATVTMQEETLDSTPKSTPLSEEQSPSGIPQNAVESQEELPPWEVEDEKNEVNLVASDETPSSGGSENSQDETSPMVSGSLKDEKNPEDSVKKINIEDLTEEQKNIYTVVSEAFGDGVEVFTPGKNNDEQSLFDTQG